MIRNSADFAKEPLLGLLCTADTALDAVVGSLLARHPRLEQDATYADSWHRDLRRAQILARAIRTSQALLTDYYGAVLDQARAESDDDIQF